MSAIVWWLRSRSHSRDAVVLALRDAFERSDARAVSVLLAPGSTVVVDSGSEPSAGRGSGETASALIAAVGGEVTVCSVNGQQGLLARRGGQVVAIVNLRIRRGRVRAAWVTTNPQKLKPWNL